MLQKNFKAQQNQNDAAHNLGLLFVAAAEDGAHFDTDGGEHKGGQADEQNGKIICERIVPFDELPKQLWLRFDTMDDYKKNESRLLETIRESDGGDEVIIYIADTKQMKKLGRNYSVNANNELMERLFEFLDKENAKIVEKNIEKLR